MSAIPARALWWAIGETWGRWLASFVTMTILARLLGPDAWGLVALALVPVVLAEAAFVQGGWGEALVQRAELADEHLASAFWAVCALCIVSCLVILAAAPAVARLYDQRGLAPVVALCALMIPIRGLAVVPTALLRRDLAFRDLAVRACLATSFGGTLGVAAAFGGAGLWSLVTQHLATASLELALVWRATRWRPGVSFSPSHWRDINRYGAASAADRLLHAGENVLVRSVLGIWLGPSAAGALAMTRSLLDLVAQLLVHPSTRVALVLGARAHAEKRDLTPIFENSLRATTTIGVPAFVGLATLASVVLVALFGPQWSSAATLLAGMAVAAASWPLANAQVAMIRATGRATLDLAVGAVSVVVLVLLLVPALAYGLAGVGVAFALRAWLMVPVRAAILAHTASLSSGKAIVLPVLAAATVMAIALLALDRLLSPAPTPGWLLLAIVTGALVFGCTLLAFDRGAFPGTLRGYGFESGPRRVDDLLLARLPTLWRPVAKRRRIVPEPAEPGIEALLERPPAAIVTRLIEDNLLPFWRRIECDRWGCADLHHDVRGRHLGARHPRLVIQARWLWFWSLLARTPFAEPDDRHRAEKAFTTILRRFADDERGGFVWEVSARDGRPTNSEKTLYGHSFVLFALAEYSRLEAGGRASRHARELLDLIERRFWNPERSQFVGCLAEDWSSLPRARSGRAVDGASLDDLIHLLEAYLAWQVASDDCDTSVRIEKVARDLAAHIGRELSQPSHPRSYGHTLEVLHLLAAARRIVAVDMPDLTEVLRRTCAAAQNGRQGGLATTGTLAGAVLDSRRIWWVQAEALLAAVTLDQDDLTAALLRWIVLHQADWRSGEWHATIDPDGRASGYKAGPWRGPYHVGRALLGAHHLLSAR